MRQATEVLDRFVESHRVSEPVSAGRLTLVGLVNPSPSRLPYVSLAEALERSLVQVEEVTEGGRVSECRVQYQGKDPLLLLEGEEIRGAKQNRVVNASLLLEPGSTTPIPVSCVERGRWAYRSRSFSSGSWSPPSLGSALKRSVSDCLRRTGGYRSDQSSVWASVDTYLGSSGTHSPTSSLSDVYDSHAKELEEVVTRLEFGADWTGFAVYHDGRLVACELFDRPEVLKRISGRLRQALAVEAVFGPARTGAPDEPRRLAETLRGVSRRPATVHRSIGRGESVRLDDTEWTASGLVSDDVVLHFSLARAPEGSTP